MMGAIASPKSTANKDMIIMDGMSDGKWNIHLPLSVAKNTNAG
jgi:hypothetical protein